MYLLFKIMVFRLVCQIITQFKEQGLNTELYYKNKEMGETFSIVPTLKSRKCLGGILRWKMSL